MMISALTRAISQNRNVSIHLGDSPIAQPATSPWGGGSDVPAAIDGDRLAGDVLREIRREEADGVGDVLRGRHAAQRHFLDVLLVDLLRRPAARLRLLPAEPLHPRAVDDARVHG